MPTSHWPYIAPHLTANVKQEMCAEFDKSLARLIDASDEFFQAAFQIEYMLDNLGECRVADPGRLGRLCLEDSPALRQRIDLGGNELVQKCLDLNETLEDIRHLLDNGEIRLPSPDGEDQEDNDEPAAVPSRFQLQYPTGGDDCSS